MSHDLSRVEYMADERFIRWNAHGVEVEQPGEKEKIREVAEQFNRFQMMNFNEHHHCLRGTHLKTHGCVVGKFIVKDDLPPHLAQGMFAKPGKYDAIMRYSSLTPKIVPDNIPAPRGIGLKIFGVQGERIPGNGNGYAEEGDMNAQSQTQDWTFNNYPILELRDPKTTWEIANCLERYWDDMERFKGEQGKRVDGDVATMGGQLPRQQLVAMPQYSQSAYRFGDYVAKFGVFPLGEAQRKLEKEIIPITAPINILSQLCRDFHIQHKVTYSFCAQLLQNLEDQPVDDLGIEWDVEKYPFEEIGKIEFEPQDSWIPEFRVWWDDRITLNPWHGLKAHQPLGSTNRMRRVVYAESRKLRLRVNGYKDYVEPASLRDVPAPTVAPRLDFPYQDSVKTVEVSS